MPFFPTSLSLEMSLHADRPASFTLRTRFLFLAECVSKDRGLFSRKLEGIWKCDRTPIFILGRAATTHARHYITTLFSSRLAFSSTLSWQGFSV